MIGMRASQLLLLVSALLVATACGGQPDHCVTQAEETWEASGCGSTDNKECYYAWLLRHTVAERAVDLNCCAHSAPLPLSATEADLHARTWAVLEATDCTMLVDAASMDPAP